MNKVNETNETKKYELTNETITLATGKVLHRIKALRDIYDECNNLIVEARELGGFVEKEDNLSHSRGCWVFNNAKVYGNAWVSDNARVYGNATICGNVMIYGNAWVSDNARICGNARVCGNAMVCNNANVSGIAMVYGDTTVYGNATVCGNAWVYDEVCVCDNAKVCDNARVYGNAKVYNNIHIKDRTRIIIPIKSDKDYYIVGPIGSRKDYTTFQKSSEDNKIYAATGCFKGTLDEFIIAVRKTHRNNEYAKEYFKAIDDAKVYFE